MSVTLHLRRASRFDMHAVFRFMFRTTMLAAFTCILFIITSCSKPATNEQSSQSSAIAQTASSKWEGHLIRRPGSTPEDGKVYLVKDGKKHWVVSAAWLKQHGYKFPDDVQLISAQELAQIPEAEPYQ